MKLEYKQLKPLTSLDRNGMNTNVSNENENKTNDHLLRVFINGRKKRG